MSARAAAILILAAACQSPAASQVPPPPEGAPTTPALQRLLAQDQVEAVLEGYAYAEGPLWHPDGYLLFADSPRDRVLRWVPGQDASVFREPSDGTTDVALDPSGRLLAAEARNRRISRTEADGSLATVVDRFEGKRLNSPNDLVVGPDGTIFFTDPPYGLPRMREGKELGFQGVYRLDPDGRLRLLVRDLPRPNGIGLAPEAHEIYVTDSERGELRAYHLDKDGGVTTGRLLSGIKPWKAGVQGVPDGLTLDAEGRIYVSGPGGVWVFDARGGRLGVIATPEAPAACTFGGKDGRTLYVAARTRIYAIRLNVKGAR